MDVARRETRAGIQPRTPRGVDFSALPFSSSRETSAHAGGCRLAVPTVEFVLREVVGEMGMFPSGGVASARPRYDVAGGALVPAPCRRRRRRGRRGGPRETRAFDGEILARLARLAWFRHARLVAGDAARAAVTSPPAVSGTTASTEAADAAAATTAAADATTATKTTTAILPAHHRGPSSRSPPRPPETRPRGR